MDRLLRFMQQSSRWTGSRRSPRSSPSSRTAASPAPPSGSTARSPAVSRDVAELEAHLDARLLNRTTRRLSLTETGRAFHERCVQLLADLEEAEQSASQGGVTPRGTLKLTCPITYGERVLAPVVRRVRREHRARAARHRALGPRRRPRRRRLRPRGAHRPIGSQLLVARRIGTTAIVCCASPSYLARRGTPRTPDDLAGHACLTYEYSRGAQPVAVRVATTDARRVVRVSGAIALEQRPG